MGERLCVVAFAGGAVNVGGESCESNGFSVRSGGASSGWLCGTTNGASHAGQVNDLPACESFARSFCPHSHATVMLMVCFYCRTSKITGPEELIHHVEPIAPTAPVHRFVRPIFARRHAAIVTHTYDCPSIPAFGYPRGSSRGHCQTVRPSRAEYCESHR